MTLCIDQSRPLYMQYNGVKLYRVMQTEEADLRRRMAPMMLVQPSRAIRSTTDSAVTEDTQQPCANPAAMLAAAASVSLSLRTELKASP